MTADDKPSRYILRQPLVPQTVAADLLRLVVELATRLKRDEMAGRRPIELDRGQVLSSAELPARIVMVLAEVARCISLAKDDGQQVSAARWEALVEELRHLKGALDSRG